MTSIIATDADVQAGLAALRRIDPRLTATIARCDAVPLRRRAGGFGGLANIVISQQVSVASARAIFARFEARFAPYDTALIRHATDEDLRSCGLSAPKMRTLRAVAAAIDDRALVPAALPEMTADDAHAALTRISGIGPWTADIYLMFCIGHGDAFAAGDLALQEAARLILALPARPDARALAAIAESWRPWRAVAARLLWRYYAIAKQREGAPIPA
jgi:DNA-3-methyladenine glycosylase II